MKVLVLGTGGREHALAWKIAQSPRRPTVYFHPGNAGAEKTGLKPLNPDPLADPETLGAQARAAGVSLVVIGPENLLAAGYADSLRSQGMQVVGPNRVAAQLETSKIFAKQFMVRANIPTAPFTIVEGPEEFADKIQAFGARWPMVLKLDGLAAGKGVLIAQSAEDADGFAQRIWQRGEFGAGPHRLLAERFIPGTEISYIGLCDGKRFVALESATDFKRIGEGNTGPNTGGMGAISPSPYFSMEIEQKIQERVIDPMLRQLQSEKLPYQGAIFVGLMIDEDDEPHVLEFNARFGDPETQAILLRLESDFIELLESTATGKLSSCPAPRWSNSTSLYVVAAAEGYPGTVRNGDEITGLDRLGSGVQLFFSGVRETGGRLMTQGGRVLGVGALGTNTGAARDAAYSALSNIQWKGMYFRKDIGRSNGHADFH